jgi:hypothetical protein
MLQLGNFNYLKSHNKSFIIVTILKMMNKRIKLKFHRVPRLAAKPGPAVVDRLRGMDTSKMSDG